MTRINARHDASSATSATTPACGPAGASPVPSSSRSIAPSTPAVRRLHAANDDVRSTLLTASVVWRGLVAAGTLGASTDALPHAGAPPVPSIANPTSSASPLVERSLCLQLQLISDGTAAAKATVNRTVAALTGTWLWIGEQLHIDVHAESPRSGGGPAACRCTIVFGADGALRFARGVFPPGWGVNRGATAPPRLLHGPSPIELERTLRQSESTAPAQA